MDDPKRKESGIGSDDCKLSIPLLLSEVPVCFGDRVYITVEIDGNVFILRYFDHQLDPHLVPLSDRRLMLHCLFQIKEELVVGTRPEKFNTEKRRGTLVKPGSRVAFLHLVSAKYLDINFPSGLEEDFGSRLTKMSIDKCIYLKVSLQSSQKSFQNEFDGKENVLLKVEDTRDYFNFCATRGSHPIAYFGNRQSVWRIHVYDRCSDETQYIVPYGIPFRLHSNYSGKYLTCKSSEDEVRITAQTDILQGLWIIEAPDGLTGSLGNHTEAVRLQHFETACFFTGKKKLSKDDPECVWFNTAPLRIDKFVTVKMNEGFLKVKETLDADNLKNSILSRVPGVQSQLDVEFNSVITKPEVYQFEIIHPGFDQTATLFQLEGFRRDFRAAGVAIKEFYETRDEKLLAALNFEQITGYFESLIRWSMEAREGHFLLEFLQMFVDFDIHYECSLIATYSCVLHESGLLQFSAIMEALAKAEFYSENTWRVLEEPRFRKLMSIAPSIWTLFLIGVFKGMRTSGTTSLVCALSMTPHYLSTCLSTGKLPQDAVDCLKHVLDAVNTQYSEAILNLGEIPLVINNSVSSPIIFCHRNYNLEELKEIESILDLYTHFARRLVYPAFEKLRNSILREMTGKSKNILDTCVLTGLLNEEAVTIGRLQIYATLNRLNIILKCRSEIGKITVQYASEVVCACPDFVETKTDVFEVELQKWEHVQYIIKNTPTHLHWAEELFDYADGCLFAMDYLVNHFNLGPVQVLRTMDEVYSFLLGYAVNMELPRLPPSWTINTLRLLQDITTRTKTSVTGVKRCFSQALSLLTNCVKFFQLQQLRSKDTPSPFLSATIFAGKGRGRPFSLKCEILKMLKNLIENVLLFPFLKDHLEDISFLVGAIQEFRQIVSSSQDRVMSISSNMAMELCASLDAIIGLDLLAQAVKGESLSKLRLEEIKGGLRTLNSMMPEDGNVELFSRVQKMLSALKMTDILLLLIELTHYASDSDLLSLVFRMLVKMCVQHPENKAKIRNHLHSLEFAYELPEFIELLDEFGFLAGINIDQLRMLVSTMIKRYIEEEGKAINALNRLADVFKSIIPLFIIIIEIVEAVKYKTRNDDQKIELLTVLQKLAFVNKNILLSLQMNHELMAILQRLGLSDFFDEVDEKQEAKKSILRSMSVLAKQRTNIAVQKTKTEQDFEIQASSLSKIHLTGHKLVLECLEKSRAISIILDSFQSLSGSASKPLYFTVVQLFKLMGNAKKRMKARVNFSQASIDSVRKSGLHRTLVYSLLTSKSPKFTMMLLRCLRTLMQVNSEVVKEEILGVLRENKHYFLMFSAFIRLCEQYLAEVHKASNPQFNLLVEYIKFFTVGCDLCNTSFQNFLREQIKGSTTNIDVMIIVLKLMTAVGSHMNVKLEANKSISSQHKYMMRCLMTFITEAISGPNIANQSVIGSKKDLYFALNFVVKSLLKVKNHFTDDDMNTASSILSLLFALMEKEGSTDQSEVFKTMGNNNLNLDFLKELMVHIQKSCPNYQHIGVRICIFLCDFKAKASPEAEESIDPEVAAAIRYYSEFIGNVEIERDNTIYSVLFPIDDKAKYLTDFTKESLLKTIHKQPLRQEKLDDMLSGVKTCLIEINILANDSSWLVRWSPYWLVANRLSFMFAIIINALMLFYVRGTYHESRLYMSDNLAWTITLLGVAQCVCYFIGTLLYWNTYYYTLYYPLVSKSSVQEIKELANDVKLNRFKTPFNKDSEAHDSEQEKELQTGNIVQLLYNLSFLGISIFSIFYPALYALLLMGVFSQNERFDTIIKALTTNWQLLGVTAVLMCIIIYEFSMIGYLFFYSYYNSQTNLECDDLFNCFVSTLNIGLQGGLGDSLAELREEDYWERFIFDVSFQIIIAMVFLNVVFGIIIDAFGDLRDERTGIENDVNNKCLVCGGDRSTIDLRGETWQRHITQVHSYDMYLNFMLYIHNKNIEDCSGIEKYVKDEVAKNSVSFMPNTSAALKKSEEEQEEKEERKKSQRYEHIIAKVEQMLEA